LVASLKVGIFGFTIYEVTCPHAQTGISPGLGYFSLGVFFKELYLFLELKVNALLYLTQSYHIIIISFRALRALTKS